MARRADQGKLKYSDGHEGQPRPRTSGRPLGRRNHNDYDPDTFAQEVKAARRIVGVSQKALAERAGVSESWLSRLKDSKTTADREKRLRIIDALDVIGRDKSIFINVAALRHAAGLEVRDATTADDLQPEKDDGSALFSRREIVGAFPVIPWLDYFLLHRGYDRHLLFNESADALVLARRYVEGSNAKSLVAAQDAITQLHRGEYINSKALYKEAVKLLSVPIPTTARRVSSRRIESAFQGFDAQFGIEAFALIWQWRGLMSQFEGDFTSAEIAFGNRQRAGEVLGDTPMRADALTSQGIVILEQGTAIEPSEFAWRVPRDEKAIRRSLDTFSLARQFRASASSTPRSTEFDAADEWRQEANAYLMLLEINDDLATRRGYDRARTTAKELAEAGLARTRMHLALDQGRWLLADANNAAADGLEEAKTLAIQGRSPATLSLVLGQLAALECSGSRMMNPASQRHALDLAAAALIVWPFPFRTRDADHDLDLFESLEGSTCHLRRFLENDSKLRDEVLTVIGKDVDERIVQAARQVDRRY